MGEALAYDIVIVGGGPAGIAAACSAAECDKRVLVVDNMPAPGGNIWRGTGTPGHARPPLFETWSARLKRVELQPKFLSGATVFAAPGANRLCAETAEGVVEIQWQKLILATGARELFLPFPGWTLPNVFGVGGLQALAKGGWPVKGKRIVIAGTGPLLLACGAQLREEGATIPWIAEQAPFGNLFSMGMQLPLLAPSKIFQGMGLKWALRGVPFKMGSWVTEARGKGKLESVVISHGGKMREFACDYLACGFSLIPNLEVPRMLGCGIENDVVTTDDWGETSLEGVYCAGESRGIGGVDSSLLEGEIAGYTAAGARDEARHLMGHAKKANQFRRALAKAFALRPELAKLAKPETIVCRCEDVTHADLSAHATFRSAKLHTRCGMGPCQGRVCGGAVQTIFGWESASVRPPVLPVGVGALAEGGKSE